MTDEDLAVGQVWEWTIAGDPYNIRELYLLLRQPIERFGFSIAHESADYLWEVLNLETGDIELVTPFFTAGLWERVE